MVITPWIERVEYRTLLIQEASDFAIGFAHAFDLAEAELEAEEDAARDPFDGECERPYRINSQDAWFRHGA